MTRRRTLIAAIALAAVGAVLVSTFTGRSAGIADQRVLVLRHAVRSGSTLTPADMAVIRYPGRLAPAGALRSAADAAFRQVAVALPAGLPLLASFLRDTATPAPLRRGERAIGVRVDDVTGLPQLLRPGTHADVLVQGVLRVEDAEVMARPRRDGDGVSWSVALRLPAAVAADIAHAETRGEEIRLLPRDVRP